MSVTITCGIQPTSIVCYYGNGDFPDIAMSLTLGPAALRYISPHAHVCML